MNIRTISAMILALCVSAQICLAADENKISSRASIVFQNWGFSAEIPPPFKRIPFTPGGNTLYAEIFICGDYAYTVEIIKTPPTSLASTFIEQTIQTDLKSDSTSAKRWELDSRQGDLFKGVSKPFQYTSDYPAELGALLGNKDGVCSVSMAATKGESAPVLRIGVISSTDKQMDVDAKAKFLATFVRFIRNVPVPAPKPAVKPISPKPIAAPVAKPKNVHFLIKGEIELKGIVVTVGKGSVVLSVSEVRLPNFKPVILSPARAKTVLLKKIPVGVGVGAKIIVVGKNSGVGKPVRADIISPM